MIGVMVLMDVLWCYGVDMIFGYFGGVIFLIYDVFYIVESEGWVKYILVWYEQVGIYVVDVYVCVIGKVGVCFGMLGFGVINLVIGIVIVQMDLVFMVVIIGQVLCLVIGIDVFQEIDIFGIILLIVKYFWVVCDLVDFVFIVVQVFLIVVSGCLGFVLIDILKDVGQEMFDYVLIEFGLIVFKGFCKFQFFWDELILLVFELIVEVECLLFYVGGGVILVGVYDSFWVIVECYQIFVIIILMGKGVFDENDFFLVGMFGMYGMVYVNFVVIECDLLIVVGVCFDDWVIGKFDIFVFWVWVIYFEIDLVEIGKICCFDVVVFGDLGLSVVCLVELSLQQQV